MHPALPTPGSERLELLDALRGFALMGVLLVNLRSLSLYEFLPEAGRAALPSAEWDRLIAIAASALVEGKSITLFSLLFGVGFAMQMRRTTDTEGGLRHYAWRLLILLGIGAVHAYLFWWGDILRYYAVMGLLLIPLARLSTRTLAWLGVLVALLPSVLLQPIMPSLLPPLQTQAESSASSLAAFSSTHLAVMLEGNLARDLRMRLAIWMLPFFVLGRVMIGAALGRAGVLYEPRAHARFWRRLLAVNALVGGVLTSLLLLRDHGGVGASLTWLASEPGRWAMRLLRNAAPLSLGLAYLAAFVVLFDQPAWRRWLQGLAPVGRMALSNYLGQTVLAMGLFYGVGAGLGPRFGLTGMLVAWAMIFAPSSHSATGGWRASGSDRWSGCGAASPTGAVNSYGGLRRRNLCKRAATQATTVWQMTAKPSRVR